MIWKQVYCCCLHMLSSKLNSSFSLYIAFLYSFKFLIFNTNGVGNTLFPWRWVNVISFHHLLHAHNFLPRPDLFLNKKKPTDVFYYLKLHTYALPNPRVLRACLSFCMSFYRTLSCSEYLPRQKYLFLLKGSKIDWKCREARSCKWKAEMEHSADRITS